MNKQEAIEAAKDIPWARWIAQDADGEWFAYEEFPNLGETHWYPSTGLSAFLGEGQLCTVFEVHR